jgi:ribonuclease P protein component
MLPTERRLRTNRQFRSAYTRGRVYSNALLTLTVSRRDPAFGPARIGFVVTKRHGNAVCRNRIRRRLREVLRPRLPRLTAHVDLVISGKAAVRDAEWPALCASVDELLSRARLFPGRREGAEQGRRPDANGDPGGRERPGRGAPEITEPDNAGTS